MDSNTRKHTLIEAENKDNLSDCSSWNRGKKLSIYNSWKKTENKRMSLQLVADIDTENRTNNFLCALGVYVCCNKSDSGVYNWCDHVDSGVYACCDQSNSVFSYCNQSDSAYTIVVITKN